MERKEQVGAEMAPDLSNLSDADLDAAIARARDLWNKVRAARSLTWDDLRARIDELSVEELRTLLKALDEKQAA